MGSAEHGVVTLGIINLAKTAVKEFGPYNITVNAITAGIVETPTNFKLNDKEIKAPQAFIYTSNALSINSRSISI